VVCSTFYLFWKYYCLPLSQKECHSRNFRIDYLEGEITSIVLIYLSY
jgi:hypothetical protein